MNEQLIVKNFGPIKDATVDFKRVTVFIGPTGGGKSTLAKLGSAFLGGQVKINKKIANIDGALKQLGIFNYKLNDTFIKWTGANGNNLVIDRAISIPEKQTKPILGIEITEDLIDKLTNQIINTQATSDRADDVRDLVMNALIGDTINSNLSNIKRIYEINYIPTERVFIPSIEYSWAGLMRDDIGLPKLLLQFANEFSLYRKGVSELEIPFLDIKYIHNAGRDLIKIPSREEPLMLFETASGIQSVIPMLVLLEHLSRNTEQAQSFIIEEPELNLYPTAQQGLLNWLLEKCTKGENDLIITTHSPYLLAHFNTLLFAYQVAQNHPERADEIAKVVPRESWINPAEFAAYHVEGQQENGVRSIVNPETGLISYNGLDAIASAEATEFEKLLDINAGLAVE